MFRNHNYAAYSTWEQSFSPVVDKTTLQLFFTMVRRKKLFLRQADVITPNLVRQLLRALYGHPRAGQLWNVDLIQFMLGEGFIQCSRDECLFIHPKLIFLLLLYVDDLLGACELLGVYSNSIL